MMSHIAKAEVVIKVSLMVPFVDDGAVVLEDQAEGHVKDAITLCVDGYDDPDADVEIEYLDVVEMQRMEVA